MIAKIEAPENQIRATINLPASKSLSNRVLIIRALSESHFELENLSEAEDTKILLNALSSKEKVIDIGAAGTAMRFLTAYFAIGNEEKNLTGTERMKQRPIAPLVDALKKLGADIEYLEKAGFPPLRIKGKKLTASEVEVDGSFSSQFLSALLMISPLLANGLEISIKGNLVSKPYAIMTIDLMKHFGVEVQWHRNNLEIPSQTYKENAYKVEPDWSSAAFWYSVVALSENAEITLPGLEKNSLQGDSVLPEIMKDFGVKTTYLEDGILINKSKLFTQQSTINIDFTNSPDLAQCVTVLAAALDREIRFSGIENLKIKETDRVKALQTELKKFGTKFFLEDNHYILKNNFRRPRKYIETFDDHRMVMAFTPLSICFRNVSIENPETVKKSYPGFLNDLISCGFKISYQE